MASQLKLICSGMLFWLLMPNSTKGISNYATSILLMFVELRDTGELLVLEEGKIHNILCTAPVEGPYTINWGTTLEGEAGNEDIIVVGEEEAVSEGVKGRRVTFTATPVVNNTILTCVVINFNQPSSVPETLEFIIIIQGFCVLLHSC